MPRVSRAEKPQPIPGALKVLLSKVPAEPELATLTENIANPVRYWFELKFDGYRAMAYCRGRDVVIMSRSALDWTSEFPLVAEALRALNLRECVLDGEVCAIDEDGVPRFNLLQNRRKGTAMVYAGFDVLWHDGKDLRGEAIEVRRGLLEKTIGRDTSKTVFATSAVEGDPQVILQVACKAGYEGIVGKERGSRYIPGKSRTWLKLKCHRRQEFAVVGYVPLKGTTNVVGALLLAVYEGGRFSYAGRVGTGFTGKQRSELAHALDRAQSAKPTADNVPSSGFDPPTGEPRPKWSKPGIVVEVCFLERTPAELRHASFKGIRVDKQPQDCRWEESQ